MSEAPQIQPEPGNEEIREALERAENLLEAVNNYRKVAQGIDEQFERANEDRRLSLDDMPYGEELIRTRDLPIAIEKAIDLLTHIETGEVSSTNLLQTLQKVEEIIEDARNTLDDCTALPPNND